MENHDALTSLKKSLSSVSRLAYQRGLTTGTGGNISVRLPGGNLVLITASGVSLGETDETNLISVDLEGNLVEGSPGFRPSKETPFHTLIYRIRPEVGAVVHVHPPFATAYAVCGLAIPLLTASSYGLEGIPLVDYAPAGSRELAEYVQVAVTNHPRARVFLLKNHGLIALGPSLTAAYDLADLVEGTAKIGWLSSFIGANQ